MALSLKDPETDRLAREVASLTGESLTQAVRTALAERLERERRKRGAGEEPGRAAERDRAALRIFAGLRHADAGRDHRL